MTKEEAKKMLTNTKVYVNGKSKEIQEKLFEIGLEWFGHKGNAILHVDSPFLYLTGDITYNESMLFFKDSPLTEISAEDILSIKLDEEFNLKDGDIFCASDIFGYHWISIFNRLEEPKCLTHIDLCIETCSLFNPGFHWFNITNVRLATEEEKEKLFFDMKKQGLFWNAGTKQVESIKKEHEFKPFDRVLVRDDEDENWRINLFAKKETDTDFPYRCIGEVYSFCIPYEGNESLLGTSNSPEK